LGRGVSSTSTSSFGMTLGASLSTDAAALSRSASARVKLSRALRALATRLSIHPATTDPGTAAFFSSRKQTLLGQRVSYFVSAIEHLPYLLQCSTTERDPRTVSVLCMYCVEELSFCSDSYSFMQSVLQSSLLPLSETESVLWVRLCTLFRSWRNAYSFLITRVHCPCTS